MNKKIAALLAALPVLPAVADVRVAPAACPVSDTPLSPPEPLLDRQYGDAA